MKALYILLALALLGLFSTKSKADPQQPLVHGEWYDNAKSDIENYQYGDALNKLVRFQSENQSFLKSSPQYEQAVSSTISWLRQQTEHGFTSASGFMANSKEAERLPPLPQH